MHRPERAPLDDSPPLGMVERRDCHSTEPDANRAHHQRPYHRFAPKWSPELDYLLWHKRKSIRKSRPGWQKHIKFKLERNKYWNRAKTNRYFLNVRFQLTTCPTFDDGTCWIREINAIGRLFQKDGSFVFFIGCGRGCVDSWKNTEKCKKISRNLWKRSASFEYGW